MYAQKAYPQHMGNGNYTIAETGCFLTADCNLLQKLNGTAPDPPSLNEFYKAHGAYVDAAPRDGWLDDLDWNSVSRYDGTITVSQVGAGSLPPSNNAIVRFHYNSVHSGQPIDHFCAVDHIENGQVFIIDSWDGQVKGPGGYQGVYHLPVGWATYNKTAPVSVPVPAQPPVVIHPYTIENIAPKQVKLKVTTHKWGLNYDNWAAITNNPQGVANAGDLKSVVAILHHNLGGNYYLEDANNPSGYNVVDCDDYTAPPPPTPSSIVNFQPLVVDSPKYEAIVKDIPGYNNSSDAVNRHNPFTTVKAGDQYYKFNDHYNMVNVTLESGKPGAWINPADNVPDAIPLANVTDSQRLEEIRQEQEAKLTPPAITPPEPDWRTTFKAFTNSQGKREPRRYKTVTDVDFTDLEERYKTKSLPANKIVYMSGPFTKDGLTYLRPQKAAEQFIWYGTGEFNIDGSPRLILEPEDADDIPDYATTKEERQHLGNQTISDYVDSVVTTIKNLLDSLLSIFKNKKDK